MGMRILLGSALGAIAVFLASFAWNSLPGLAEAREKNIANEDVVINAMRSTIHEPGFYIFPGPGRLSAMAPEQRQAAEKRWNEKYAQGPVGVLIYAPGQIFNFGKTLFIQFLIGLVGAFLAAGVLGLAVAGLPSYGARVLVVIVMGLFGGIIASVPYWNWYSFPLDYTVTYVAGLTVSWGVAGLVMAAIVKRPG